MNKDLAREYHIEAYERFLIRVTSEVIKGADMEDEIDTLHMIYRRNKDRATIRKDLVENLYGSEHTGSTASTASTASTE